MTTVPHSASDGNPSSIPTCPGIYQITCAANGRIYIGSAVDLRKRKWNHFSDLRCNKHRNSKLQRAWNKYGPDAFVFEVLELVLIPELLTAREQYWFNKLKPFGERGFNLAREAASPALGHTVSPEARTKMRQTHLGNTYNLGRKRSPEAIERLSASHRGKPSTFKGKHHTPEAIEKVKQARKRQIMLPRALKPNAYRVDGDVSYIHLSRGKEAIISTVDLEQVLQVRWYVAYDQRTGNYRAIGMFQGERITLNRYIVGAQKDEWVDHLNLNTLDDRRENLHLRNTPNHERVPSTSTTGIRGVTRSYTNHGRKPRYKFTCQYAACRIQKRFPYTEEGLEAARIFAEAHYAAMKKG